MKLESIVRVVVKTLFVPALIAACVAQTAHGQGTVLFNNKVSSDGINAPIYDLTVGGSLLEGSGFLAQLYSGPVGTTEDKLVPTGAIVDFRTNVAAGYLNVGANGSRVIPNVAVGESAVLQIRAWTASSGTNYEAALASFDPNGRAGKSDMIVVVTKPSLLLTPASMTGLQPFAIVSVVPEPSVQLLGAAGLALLAIHRRSRAQANANAAETNTPASTADHPVNG